MKIFKLYSVIIVERPPCIHVDLCVQQTFIRQLQDSMEFQGVPGVMKMHNCGFVEHIPHARHHIGPLSTFSYLILRTEREKL